MAMDVKSYKICIEELEAVKSSIDEKIRQIREENGIDMSDAFDEKFSGVICELKKLIVDRRENEDVHTLWEIQTELYNVQATILSDLKDLAE